MKIHHKTNIFFENKKWVDKKIFKSKKNIDQFIYDLSHLTIKECFSKSKFKKLKKEKNLKTYINFILADDRILRKLNIYFLKKNKSTNVLSFPNEDFVKKEDNFLGEIFLAYETCYKESKKYKIDKKDRIGHLIVHGTLHLLGFDHKNKKDEKKMQDIEYKVLNLLGINYY